MTYLNIICKFLCMLLIYAVFLKCFFPVRNGLPGYSKPVDPTSCEHLNNQSLLYTECSRNLKSPVFDKLVFVVIDALRTDFVSSMANVKQLWRRGRVMWYTANVHPPTVTLPRIKALTTGSIPGFVDVVLNFGSTELTEDNIISQMRRAGKKVMFFGDDTWIRLFPDHFVQSEGTTSFFVMDYTEVDDNVTRHVSPSLRDKAFDVMILHYLGLDHIGHLAGPTSPLIPPKLTEMDGIIGEIYQHLEKDTDTSSLIVVCGDHGMSDQGGHGGATPSETRVPVLLLSPRFTTHTAEHVPDIDQTDVAPTLSVLLGLPIPINNLGVVIDTAMEGFSLKDRTMALWRNAVQVSEVLRHNIPDTELDEGYIEFQRLSRKHKDWLKSSGTPEAVWEGERIRRGYSLSIKAMARRVSSSLTEYDVYGLTVSIATLWLILAATVLDTCMPVQRQRPGLLWMVSVCVPVVLTTLLVHVVSCTASPVPSSTASPVPSSTASSAPSSLLCRTHLPALLLQGVVLTVVCGTATNLVQNLLIYWSDVTQIRARPLGTILRACPLGVFLTLGTVSHTLSLLSSSFVEEEHQTWYYYTVTINLGLIAYMVHLSYARYKMTPHVNCDSTTGQYTTTVGDSHTPTSYGGDSHDSQAYRQKCSAEGEEKNVTRRRHFEVGERKFILLRPVMAAIVVVVLCRVLRMWNQTGNKWLDRPDVGDWLARPENKPVLSVLMGMALCVVGVMKWAGLCRVQRGLFLAGLGSIYWYRATTGLVLSFTQQQKDSSPVVARLTFLLLCACTLEPVIKSSVMRFQTGRLPCEFCMAAQSGCILLLLLLLKPHNVVMFVMVVVQEHLMDSVVLRHAPLSSHAVILYYLWMGMASFFYQGNSNSISSIDVSAGYTGLTDYQPVIIGLLMAMSTYAGPVFWLVSLAKHLTTTASDYMYSTPYHTRLKLVTMCGTLCWTRALPLAVYTSLVTLQRYHLFVWTVFSPKLLYEGMTTVIVSVSCSVVLITSVIINSNHVRRASLGNI